MDKMREEFESWYESKFGDSKLIWLQSVQEYDYTSVHCMWQAWQASRAALVVELPETCCRTLVFEQENTLEVGMEHGEYYEPDDIHSALDKAGIRYE